MKLTLTIPGEPVAKGRPKIYNGHGVTPEKTVNYETLVKQLYIMQHYKQQFEGQLSMTVNAYFSIPKSASKNNRIDMASGKIRPIKRPDADNILKIIGDSLNNIAYHDDSQIVSATITKWYSEWPRVEVHLQEVST